MSRFVQGVDRRPKRDPRQFDQPADLKDSSGSSLHDIGTARDPPSDNFLRSRQSVTGIAMGVCFGRRSTPTCRQLVKARLTIALEGIVQLGLTGPWIENGAISSAPAPEPCVNTDFRTASDSR